MIPPLKSISIEVSSVCNLSCKMCIPHRPGAKSRIDQPPFINPDLFFSIVNQISQWSIVSPQFQGEPLMHPSFLTLCEYLNSKRIIFGFTTNGMLMDEVVTKELSRMDYFNSVIFSLDGFSKRTFESIRIGSNFERILSNIDYFLAYGKRPVGINFVIMEENKNELDDFVYHWLRKNVTVSSAIVANEEGLPTRLYWGDSVRRTPCILESTIILTDGTVIPCCRDHKYQMKMGNVKNQKLWDIWIGVNYKRLRDFQNQRKWSEIYPCSDCMTWMCDSKEITPRTIKMNGNIFCRQYPFWAQYVKGYSW